MYCSVLNAELYNLSFDLKWMIVCQVGYYSLIQGLGEVVICISARRINLFPCMVIVHGFKQVSLCDTH